MRIRTILPTCAALVLVSAAASAEPPPVELPHAMRLEYRVSPGAKRCPADGEHLLRASVGTHAHFEPFDANAPARLLATVQQSAAGYVARAEVFDGAGVSLWSREIIPLPACDEAIETLAFAIAFRLEPPKTAPAPSPTPPAAPPAPAPPLCVPAPEPAPARPPEPTKPPAAAEAADARRVLVGAGMALGFGVASTPAAGATLDLGIRWPVVSVSLEGRAYLPARLNVEGSAKVVSTYRLTGAFVPCGHWRVLVACVPVEAGRQQGHADASGREVDLFFAAVGLRLGAVLPLPLGVSVRASGSALFATSQPMFLIARAASWTTPFLSGALNAGIVTYF